mmetsp:Transcript_6772/g.15869  ORF Transcript_6772/g.15869 Transcript_6772/m.15869 type:complete len:219 (-) Transcript_6772:499-1155(-)
MGGDHSVSKRKDSTNQAVWCMVLPVFAMHVRTARGAGRPRFQLSVCRDRPVQAETRWVGQQAEAEHRGEEKKVPCVCQGKSTRIDPCSFPSSRCCVGLCRMQPVSGRPAGKQPEALIRILHGRLERSGASKRVGILGALSGEDRASLLQIADAPVEARAAVRAGIHAARDAGSECADGETVSSRLLLGRAVQRGRLVASSMVAAPALAPTIPRISNTG